jgi:hypothetical protein
MVKPVEVYRYDYRAFIAFIVIFGLLFWSTYMKITRIGTDNAKNVTSVPQEIDPVVQKLLPYIVDNETQTCRRARPGEDISLSLLKK